MQMPNIATSAALRFVDMKDLEQGYKYNCFLNVAKKIWSGIHLKLENEYVSK